VTAPSLDDEARELFRASCHVAFITRDEEVLKRQLGASQAFKKRLAQQKDAAIAAADEPLANHILAWEDLFAAGDAELTMCLKLKRHKPGAAWDKLIDAQMYAHHAQLADPTLAEATRYQAHLLDVERVVFPPQRFTSVGVLIRKSSCTLCGAPYRRCEHIAGRVYMGKHCWRGISRFDVMEQSIVENPADKRCRMNAIGRTPKTMTDVMTLMPYKESGGKTMSTSGGLVGLPVIVEHGRESAGS
jgi:hypothetical protein